MNKKKHNETNKMNKEMDRWMDLNNKCLSRTNVSFFEHISTEVIVTICIHMSSFSGVLCKDLIGLLFYLTNNKEIIMIYHFTTSAFNPLKTE